MLYLGVDPPEHNAFEVPVTAAFLPLFSARHQDMHGNLKGHVVVRNSLTGFTTEGVNPCGLQCRGSNRFVVKRIERCGSELDEFSCSRHSQAFTRT